MEADIQRVRAEGAASAIQDQDQDWLTINGLDRDQDQDQDQDSDSDGDLYPDGDVECIVREVALLHRAIRLTSRNPRHNLNPNPNPNPNFDSDLRQEKHSASLMLVANRGRNSRVNRGRNSGARLG